MKPDIPYRIEENWQSILNLLAQTCRVPAALIMKISPDEIEVFAKSSNQDNPYEVGATEELHGELYCERVLQTDSELLVPNALKDDEWKENPDVALSMISYCGLPLHWPDGTPFGTICILDRKENSYTESLRSLLVAFRDSVENSLELIEALELKDNILAIAAHDLRSPLAQVESLTELLFMECEESSYPNLMVPQLIQRSVAGMRELVDQLLRAQEVEAFKEQLRYEKFDLSILLEECFAEIAAALKTKEQRLTHQPRSQLSVSGNPFYIKNAIINLISNASKYSPESSQIEVIVETSDENVSIHVIDQGPGFRPEDQEKMFGKFQKLSAQPTNRETSTGLGLYIVKCIVEQHGGHIVARNSPGKGARMTFSWPGLQPECS